MADLWPYVVAYGIGFVCGVLACLYLASKFYEWQGRELDEAMDLYSEMVANPTFYAEQRQIYLEATGGPSYGLFGRVIEPESRALRVLKEQGGIQ